MLLKYLILLALILLLIVILSLSLYGLPDDITRRVEKQLQFPGIAVELDKIKLGIFEGLIATGVRCYLIGDIGDPVLTAERVVLQPRLIPRKNGTFGLRRVFIKNAGARLPTAMLDGKTPVTLENAQAQVTFEHPYVLRIEDFSATLAGVILDGQGRITLPKTRPDKRTPVDNSEIIRKSLQYYHRINFKRPPRIHAEFDLHAYEPELNVISLRLESQYAEFENHHAEDVICKLHMAENILEAGFNIRHAIFFGMPAEKISGIIRFDADAINLEKCEAVIGDDNNGGPVSLNVKYDRQRDRFEGEAMTWCYPAAILPILYHTEIEVAAEVVEDFTFTRTPPHVTAVLSGGFREPRLALAGNIQAETGAYAGVPLQIVQSVFTADFSATNANLTFGPCVAACREGSLQGTLEVDIAGERIRFDALSTTEPHAVARMIHPFIEEILEPFTFAGPVSTRAAGQIGFEGFAKDQVELTMQTGRAGWRFLMADFCELGLEVIEDTVIIRDAQGGMFNGNFTGNVSFHPAARGNDYFYAADVNADNVNFNTLMRAIIGEDTEPYQGRLSLQLQMDGPVNRDALTEAVGQGQLRIADGRIFQIPLFGGLSDMMGRFVPGLRMVMRQTDARAQFHVHNGKISSDNILIEGDVLSLRANGDCHMDGQLDFKVQINLLRQHTLAATLIRIATMPISKILEFHLGGTLDNPQWRLANIPRDIIPFLSGNTNEKK